MITDTQAQVFHTLKTEPPTLICPLRQTLCAEKACAWWMYDGNEHYMCAVVMIARDMPQGEC